MKLSEEMGNVRADQFIQNWISAINKDYQDDFVVAVYDLVREVLEEEINGVRKTYYTIKEG